MIEKDFDALDDMFGSDGWKLYVTQAEELTNSIVEAAPTGAVTNDQWQYARGQIAQLRATLGYENFVRVSWDNHNIPVNDERIIDVDSI